jgi:Rsm1-like
MGVIVVLALLVLLGIEAVKAWKARTLHCTICGRKMGLWHVEECHKKGRYSPGVSIVIILSVVVAVAIVFALVMR